MNGCGQLCTPNFPLCEAETEDVEGVRQECAFEMPKKCQGCAS